MHPPPENELEERIAGLSDDELVRMLCIEAADYREDALAFARQVAEHRNLAVPSSPESFVASLDEDDLRTSDLFCSHCLAEASDEPLPQSLQWLPTRLGPAWGTCDHCGSVLRDRIACLWVIPLWTVARYRVKQLEVPWPGEPRLLSSCRVTQDRRPLVAASSPEPPHTPEERRRRAKARRKKKRTGDGGR